MKTAVNKNESEFDRLKREALEWIENPKSRLVPSFIKIAVETAQQAQSDKDVIIKEKIKPFILDEEAVVSKWIREDKDLIIAKQEELIEFYGKIIRDSAVFLQIHHAGASPEEIETGKRLRQELQTLKSK